MAPAHRRRPGRRRPSWTRAGERDPSRRGPRPPRRPAARGPRVGRRARPSAARGHPRFAAARGRLGDRRRHDARGGGDDIGVDPARLRRNRGRLPARRSARRRRRDRTARPRGRGRPPVEPFERREVRPGRTAVARNDAGCRRRTGRFALPRRRRSLAHAGARRHDDQQRPWVEPRCATDVLRRQPDAACGRLRVRRRRRRGVGPFGVRRDDRLPRRPRRPRGGRRRDASGSRCTTERPS